MNTLVISDLHIAGCSKLPSNEPAKIDNNILQFLDYYSKNRINDKPWTLIINGDAIDFMSATVHSDSASSIDDKLHGLGSTCDKTKQKLKTIVEHYREFFSAVAQFVSAGNKLKIITGNHDLELSFVELQYFFVEELYKLTNCEYEMFVANIEFYPWFYYKQGIYVEHGHQYDEYCSTDYALAMMDNKNDIVPSVSHLGMRYFVNKIPHYDPNHAEEWGFFEYAKWAYNLGAKKTIFSLTNYFVLVYKTLLLWFKLWSTDKERKTSNNNELNIFSQASSIGLTKLKKLYYLRRSPVTISLFKIASTYFIDRMFLILVAMVGVIFFAVHLHHHWKIVVPIAVIIIGYLLNEVFNKIRFDAPSSVKLREAAKKISKILPSKIIIFGHSHSPEVSAFDNGTTYINSGSWTEDGKCTYVLITNDTYELKYWRE